jgi:hypothetical protein
MSFFLVPWSLAFTAILAIRSLLNVITPGARRDK